MECFILRNSIHFKLLRPGVRFFVLKELSLSSAQEITGKISVLEE